MENLLDLWPLDPFSLSFSLSRIPGFLSPHWNSFWLISFAIYEQSMSFPLHTFSGTPCQPGRPETRGPRGCHNAKMKQKAVSGLGHEYVLSTHLGDILLVVVLSQRTFYDLPDSMLHCHCPCELGDVLAALPPRNQDSSQS